MLGSVEPRIWTPPLRELTPDTSYGFDVIRFGDETLGAPLDPWQDWLAIHAGELLPDGRPRFRIVIVLVARQNGKTHFLVVLALYWQFVEAVPLILGTSTKLEYARESWTKSRKLAEKAPDLVDLRARGRWYKEGNNELVSWTTEDARYKIAPADEKGGRSLTIHRLILDELRQHHDYSAYGAAEPATNAVDDAQIFGLSNAGDVRSVVLNDLRKSALAMIRYIDERGEVGYGELLAAGHDPRIGLFEWSAPPDSDPGDVHALAMANPNLNRRLDGDTLTAKGRTAVATGGQALTSFRTESMCISVEILDPAIDPGGWRRCLAPGSLDEARSRVALCLDVAPDEQHATLYAAALVDDERVRVDFVHAWEGAGCVDQLRRALPGLLADIRPQVVGWFPYGPAAALTATLAKRKGRVGWPPRGVTVEPIKGDVAAVCMGFAEQVSAGRVAHSDDPLLNAQIGPTERLWRGDTWIFSRRGEGHCDAVYAAAGAAHLARTLPPPPPRPRVIVGRARPAAA